MRIDHALEQLIKGPWVRIAFQPGNLAARLLDGGPQDQAAEHPVWVLLLVQNDPPFLKEGVHIPADVVEIASLELFCLDSPDLSQIFDDFLSLKLVKRAVLDVGEDVPAGGLFQPLQRQP